MLQRVQPLLLLHFTCRTSPTKDRWALWCMNNKCCLHMQHVPLVSHKLIPRVWNGHVVSDIIWTHIENSISVLVDWGSQFKKATTWMCGALFGQQLCELQMSRSKIRRIHPSVLLSAALPEKMRDIAFAMLARIACLKENTQKTPLGLSQELHPVRILHSFRIVFHIPSWFHGFNHYPTCPFESAWDTMAIHTEFIRVMGISRYFGVGLLA